MEYIKAMLNDYERAQVWERWLAAEIRSMYFADLSHRYFLRHRITTWLTLFFSSGAAVTAVSNVPQEYKWAAPLPALMMAGISLYALVSSNQKSGIDAADLHAKWNKLASEYEYLWSHQADTESSPEKLRQLIERGEELSRAATPFPAKKRLLIKWQDYVEKHHTGKVPPKVPAIA